MGAAIGLFESGSASTGRGGVGNPSHSGNH